MQSEGGGGGRVRQGGGRRIEDEGTPARQGHSLHTLRPTGQQGRQAKSHRNEVLQDSPPVGLRVPVAVRESVGEQRLGPRVVVVKDGEPAAGAGREARGKAEAKYGAAGAAQFAARAGGQDRGAAWRGREERRRPALLSVGAGACEREVKRACRTSRMSRSLFAQRGRIRKGGMCWTRRPEVKTKTKKGVREMHDNDRTTTIGGRQEPPPPPPLLS